MESMENYPIVLKVLYCDYKQTETSKDKFKLSASCRKCKKTITADWKPNRITSNFISHANVSTVPVYSVWLKGRP